MPDNNSEPVQEAESIAQIPDAPVNEPVVQSKQSAEIPLENKPPKKWAGKYDTPEALESAYSEAQKLISSRQKIENITDLGERVGMDMSEAVNTFMADGKLNIAQLESFEKAGIGKELAQRFVEGEASRIQVMQHEVERVKTEVENIAGGRSQLETVLNWAASTMTKAEIESFNTKLNDSKSAISAAREITFLHQKAVGSGNARPLVQGMTPPSEAQGFTSVNDVVKAMSMVRKQGYVDESTRRRLANTPKKFMQGMN